jgi:lipopolysaccharide transport system permease protein
VSTATADHHAPLPPRPAPLILRAKPGWQLVDLSDLWHYRELMWFLALRDVKVRYKQALLRFMWAILQPLAAMVVMEFFFGRLAGMDGGRDDYPVFLYAGLLPWMFFAAAVSASSMSLVANAGMVQKIYFPRLIIPLAAVGAPLVDYVMGFTVLVGLMFYFQVVISWQLLWVPLLIASTILCALAIGVFLSALTVAYRDFRYVVPFIIQFGMFATPAVYYDVDHMPQKFERYRWLIDLNPMNGPIAAFRAAIMDQPINFTAWGWSTAAMSVVLMIGLMYFKQTERRFADIV